MSPAKTSQSALLKYVWPYISSAIVVTCGLLVYFLAARQFGVEGFSEYALSRRSISLLQPMLFQGFGLALTRQVAMAEVTSDSRSPFSYLVSMLFLFSVVLIAIELISLFFASSLAKLFFGSESYYYCIGPIAFSLQGIIIHCVIWSFLRGRMHIAQACILESLNIGLIPLFCFVISDGPSSLLWWTGCLTTICSATAMTWLVLQERSPVYSLQQHTNDLFKYAVPRIPGAFALAALLSVPATICAHVADVHYAGFVAFGCSLLGMAGALITPLGVIILPHSTKMMASGRANDVKRLVPRLIGIGFAASFIVVLGVEIFAESTIAYFMGVDSADFVEVIRLMILSAIPFLLFISLRGVLDGISLRALNSRNCVVSLFSLLAFLAATHNFGGGVKLIIIGSIGSMCVLAVLTLFDTYRVLNGAQVK